MAGDLGSFQKLWAIFSEFFSLRFVVSRASLASFPGPHVFGIAAKALEGWPGGIFLVVPRQGGGEAGHGFCVVFLWDFKQFL